MTAHARTLDPQPSHSAAASITDAGQRGSQQAVLSALRLHGPLTVDGITNLLGERLWTQSRLRTVCSELERLGLTYRLNETGKSRRGHSCTTWAATDKEVEQWQK